MRTETEINAEVKKLRIMKPNVRRTSMFGDNHHDSIDFQIEVLVDGLDLNDIDNLYDNGEIEENVREAGVQASDWAFGEEEQVPSEDWKSLLVN